MTQLGKVGVVVAARMSSSRLPRKAMLPLNGVPMILFLLRRLRPLKYGGVVLATTDLAADDELAALVEAEGVPVFRGAEADVVGRYVAAAAHFGFDMVARVTADCPFVDAELVDWCLTRAAEMEAFDVATTKGKFPVGLDVEIYPAGRMAELCAGDTLTASEREHLTLYFYDHCPPSVVRTIDPPSSWPRTDRHFTVDTRADYESISQLAGRFEGIHAPVAKLIESAAV